MLTAPREVDLDAHVTTASLPLIADPVTRLTPNRYKALQVYKKVVRELDKNPGDRESALKCERKLQDLCRLGEGSSRGSTKDVKGESDSKLLSMVFIL